MLLPSDRVRHVGEAVAVVVAETALQAQDAAEEVTVDYRELPWIAQIKGALTPGAIAVWDEVPDNVLVDIFGDAAATERAFAIADHIIEMEFHVGRVTGVPMEPRAALGHWDAATGRGTLWAGSGGAVRQKTELAAVLGVPPDRVRVVSLDVGLSTGQDRAGQDRDSKRVESRREPHSLQPPRSNTIGAIEPGPNNCRRKDPGGYGSSWLDAALARPAAAPNGCGRGSRRGGVGSPWWRRPQPTRATLWSRVNQGSWLFRPITSGRYTSPASAG